MLSAEDRLRQIIRTEGPIPFARFMEEALYGESGYYRRDRPAIGRDGDFITGSSYSALFGRATARLLKRLDRALGRKAEVLEAGFGRGEHLRAIVEASAPEGTRRLRAWDRVARPAPSGVEQVDDLDRIEEGEIRGLVFSYELFDALPVHRLLGRAGGEIGELWVDLDSKGAFGWLEGELSDVDLLSLLPAGGRSLAPGQVADLCPGWRSLYRHLAGKLGEGLLVTCDYGFLRAKLLDSRVRKHGTLACYRRHRVHRDPFLEPGLQDLTAHVDFTALIEVGEEEGLRTLVLTRQARWLLACGIFEDLEGADPALRMEALTLLNPAGMGDEIRVLVQARGVRAEDLFAPDLLL